jgi:hypothetical protein
LRLTFDWDDITLEESLAQEGINELKNRFPNKYIFCRVSSSGNGLHLVISDDSNKIVPTDFTDEEVIQHRTDFLEMGLECGGRLRTDLRRKAVGTKWGRLFSYKDGKPCGEWFLC